MIQAFKFEKPAFDYKKSLDWLKLKKHDIRVHVEFDEKDHKFYEDSSCYIFPTKSFLEKKGDISKLNEAKHFLIKKCDSSVFIYLFLEHVKAATLSPIPDAIKKIEKKDSTAQLQSLHASHMQVRPKTLPPIPVK